jgi:hypothetical protein
MAATPLFSPDETTAATIVLLCDDIDARRNEDFTRLSGLDLRRRALEFSTLTHGQTCANDTMLTLQPLLFLASRIPEETQHQRYCQWTRTLYYCTQRAVDEAERRW